MQLGIPITTTSGGVRAVSIVILYPQKYITASVQMTPKITTNNDKSVVVIERKKRSSISALKIKDARRKNFISF